MIASLPFANLGTVGTYIAAAPFKHLMILILQAICMSVLPYAFYTIAVNKGDAGKVAIIGSVSEPSSAVVFGIVFYNEIPTPFIFAGLVITIAALCFLCIEPKKKPRRGDPEVS